jgi:hypothetical protein
MMESRVERKGKQQEEAGGKTFWRQKNRAFILSLSGGRPPDPQGSLREVLGVL